MRKPRIQAIVPMEDIAIGGIQRDSGSLWWEMMSKAEVGKSIPDSTPRAPQIPA